VDEFFDAPEELGVEPEGLEPEGVEPNIPSRESGAEQEQAEAVAEDDGEVFEEIDGGARALELEPRCYEVRQRVSVWAGGGATTVVRRGMSHRYHRAGHVLSLDHARWREDGQGFQGGAGSAGACGGGGRAQGGGQSTVRRRAVRRRAGKSSLGDAKSSPGDVESSLGDAESSLGATLRARWGTLRARWGDAESSPGDAESSLGDVESSLG
jgi:hypothetical protein